MIKLNQVRKMTVTVRGIAGIIENHRILHMNAVFPIQRNAARLILGSTQSKQVVGFQMRPQRRRFS